MAEETDGAGDAAGAAQPLAPGALRALRQRLALRWGGVVVVLAVFATLCFGYGSPGSGAVTTVVALGAVAAWWLLTARWCAAFSWRVTDSAVEVERGLVVRRRSAVPLTQVRHVEVAAGPIDRACGVTSVVVRVAGVPTPSLVIPGLAPDVAARLREALVGRQVAAPTAA